MPVYSLVEVKDTFSRKEFLELPVRLYKSDPSYIRPLDKDVDQVFDPGRNKSFRHGELIRWILKDSNKETVGRVAAFYDEKTSLMHPQPTGGMGFFECVNDQEAANVLFDACRNWLAGNGMEAMDGPVNFGDRDRWWGLLTEGFDPPNYCTNYNFPWYKNLFENYGFRNYFEQYTYHRKIEKKGLDPVIEEKASRIFANPLYTFETIRKKDVSKYAEDFRLVYNEAWARHAGVKPITKQHAEALIRTMKPILDEKLMWFAYHDNRPVAFFLMLPELNQIFRHVNGKLDLPGMIKVLWHKYNKTVTKAFGIIFGVTPAHQGKGLEGAIVMAFAEIALKPGFQYRDLEMNWIGDFNPTMMRLVEQIGAKICKTHITYRYLFNPEQEFSRAPMLGPKGNSAK